MPAEQSCDVVLGLQHQIAKLQQSWLKLQGICVQRRALRPRSTPVFPSDTTILSISEASGHATVCLKATPKLRSCAATYKAYSEFIRGDTQAPPFNQAKFAR
jgi:hypothetical protein